MTYRLTTPSLTAAAALLILSPHALLAQEAATTDQTATEAPAADATTTEAPAAGATATGDAMATGEPMSTDDAMAAGGAATGETAATDGMASDDAAADGAMATDDAAEAATDQATMGDGTAPGEVAQGEAAQPGPEMQAVLDKLAELGAAPIGTLPPEEQRQEPTPADAVMAVMEEQGIEVPAELAAIATRDVTYPAADGSEQAARVYTPEGEGPFPLIVYYHGGGWVIADIDTYDASARALAAGANAVVVSVEYRKGPEAPFPAAHEDANAAFTHFVETSGEINADSTRLAVAGESAGGNLAMNVAIFARDNQLTPIDHVLSVYPIADDSMATPSYEAYAEAQPLSREAMMWFAEHALADPADAADPRVDLSDRDDLAGLPPVTIINAEIDPLQSEGEILAQRLGEAGVEVAQMTYPSVTHEFFGMGAVVPQAQEAVDMASEALRAAFAAE